MVGSPVPSFFGPEGLDTEGLPGPVERECLVRAVSGRGPLWGGMTRTDRGAGAAEVPDPGRGKARGRRSPGRAAAGVVVGGGGAAPSGSLYCSGGRAGDACASVRHPWGG